MAGKKPEFTARDQDGNLIEIFQVDGIDWKPLIISVTDENDIPISSYLSLADEARLFEYLGNHLKGQS